MPAAPGDEGTDNEPALDMSQTETTVSKKNFCVHLAGKTNDAHVAFVEGLKAVGRIEVDSPEDSDFLLVFCPIVSRVGTDISEAEDNIPGGKPAVLVVMHHTFSADHVVAPSTRLVTNPNIVLTVDCLFYGHSLLNCTRNDIALYEVKEFLGVSPLQLSRWQTIKNYISNWWKQYWKPAVLAGVVIGGLTTIVAVWNLEEKKN